MTLEDRIARLEIMVFGKQFTNPPNSPHKWKPVYIHGGHYPDGNQCIACGAFDLEDVPDECGS